MTMTDPDAAAERPDRSLCDWVVFGTVAAVGTAIAVALEPENGLAGTVIAAGAALLVQTLYLVLVRPQVRRVRDDDARAAWVWASIALVLFAAAVAADQWSSLLLFAISPAIFLAFRFAAAVPIVVVFDLVPLAAWLIKYPITPGLLVQALGTTAIILAVSIFFSSRIQSVLRQSEERRRLIDQLREREAQVTALSAAQGAGAERARIAREMHDTLAQGFASIVALGNAAQAELDADPPAARRHLGLITATAAENLGESRRIIAALAPGRLAGSSLPEAIHRTVDGFAAESGVATGFALEGEVRALPSDADVVLLRVAQEALTNVRRHAGAHRVDVRLAFAPDAVVLEVVDDGSGFDHAPGGARGRFGLAGMADRVADAGGELEVDSRPGEGTRLRVRIPLGATP